jgi:hypothetical protein
MRQLLMDGQMRSKQSLELQAELSFPSEKIVGMQT